MSRSDCCHKFIVEKVDLEQKKRKVCKRCGFVDYKNPKIVTGSLVIKNKKIIVIIINHHSNSSSLRISEYIELQIFF